MPTSKPRQRRENDSGSVYQRASDGMWLAALRLPNGKRKYMSSRTKTGVQEKLRTAKRDLARAGNLPTSSPSLAQWITLWLKAKKKTLKPGTYVDYERKMLNYVVPAIGRIRMERLTADHVRRVHDYIIETKGLSSTTALTTHRILAKCLTDAAREGRVVQNVATQLDAPRKAVSKRGALSADDARKLLLAAASDPVAAVHWSLALLAGLRPGERLGLTREQIDLDRVDPEGNPIPTITVSWQLQRLRWEHGCLAAGERAPAKGQQWPCGKNRGGSCPKRWVDVPPDQEATRVDGGLWLTRPKSRAGWREVPMAPGLLAVMRRHLEQSELGMHGLVLHRGDELRRPVDPSDDGAAWHRWLDIAGLEQVEPYTARHTTATLLHALGVPEKTRQQILGHSDATVTAGYTHVADAETAMAMRRLDDLLSIEGTSPS